LSHQERADLERAAEPLCRWWIVHGHAVIFRELASGGSRAQTDASRHRRIEVQDERFPSLPAQAPNALGLDDERHAAPLDEYRLPSLGSVEHFCKPLARLGGGVALHRCTSYQARRPGLPYQARVSP
jgi:hypothetical protein